MRTNLIFFILITIALFFASVPVHAQNSDAQIPTSQKHFYFVYIAPDRAVNKQTLSEELKKTVESIRSNNDPAIFYLANGSEPVIVKFNLGEDNNADYEVKIDYMIKNNSLWKINVPNDLKYIHEQLKKNDYLDASGHFFYNVTEFDFHVGKDFWDQKCNEKLIGRLFYELNAAQYINNPSFRFNVFFYCPPAEDNYDRENKFGELNPDGINQKVSIQRKQTL